MKRYGMDLSPLRTLQLFAGAGGGMLTDVILGHRPVCAVELDHFCQRILIARQQHGCLPPFDLWDDVRTFDGHPWKGRVDLIAGGFPCQDISVAGTGAGLSGACSGLWTEFARILGEVRPQYAFIENAAALTVRGLDHLLADLARLGMDARWCCLGADAVGAWHQRKRTWVFAYRDHSRKFQSQRQQPNQQRWAGDCTQETSNTHSTGLAQRQSQPGHPEAQQSSAQRTARSHDARNAGQSQSALGRVAHGLATWMDGIGWDVPDPLHACGIPALAHRVKDYKQRIMALGNGQVPLCAVQAWHILSYVLSSRTQPHVFSHPFNITTLRRIEFHGNARISSQ